MKFIPAYFMVAQNKVHAFVERRFVQVQKGVMIAASGGVQLATDIYRPSKDGVLAKVEFPVIL